MEASDPRRRLGDRGERVAAAHLERLGYNVLATNVRTRIGEIDLVAASPRTLVVCEVKTRISARPGDGLGPLESIGPRKRRRLRRLTGEYLINAPREAHRDEVRIDAIAVTIAPTGEVTAVEHVEGIG